MYFFSLVVIGCASIAGTVCVLHLWHKNADDHFPPILRRLLRSSFAKYWINSNGGGVYKDSSGNREADELKLSTDIDFDSGSVFSISGMLSLSENGTYLREIKNLVNRYHVTGATNVQNVTAHKDKSDSLTEWQQTAILLDGIFFMVLCVTTIVVLISTIISFSLQDYNDV